MKKIIKTFMFLFVAVAFAGLLVACSSVPPEVKELPVVPEVNNSVPVVSQPVVNETVVAPVVPVVNETVVTPKNETVVVNETSLGDEKNLTPNSADWWKKPVVNTTKKTYDHPFGWVAPKNETVVANVTTNTTA